MAKRHFLVGAALAALTAFPAGATTIIYNDFSSTAGLTLVGSANNSTPGVVELTPAAALQGGAVYTSNAVALGAGASFSTQFQFQLSNKGGVGAADGITFFLAKTPTNLGRTGGTLGLSGSDWNSIGLEFDTYFNPGTSDPNGNHIALAPHASLVNLAWSSPYGLTDCQSGSIVAGCLADGNIWTATINYDGIAKLINVSLYDPALGYVFQAITNYSIDIAALLGGTNAYVGFTGSTGGGFQQQDILSWQFYDTPTMPVVQAQLLHSVPEPLSLSLLAGGAAGAFFLRRRKPA